MSNTPISDLIDAMLSGGHSQSRVDTMRKAVRALEEKLAAESKSSGVVDAVAARRRKWDRERKAAKRAASGGMSALPQSDALSSSVSIKDSLSSKKESKNRVSGGIAESRVDTLFPLDDWPDDYEKQFWDAWPAHPRKYGRKQTMAKLARVRQKKEATWKQIMDGLAAYLASMRRKPQYIPEPERWVNKQKWVGSHSMIIDDQAGDGQPSFADYQRLARGTDNGQ